MKTLVITNVSEGRECLIAPCLYPYRYGMNGKKKDDEIVGSGNSYDFGARQYDPRLGRWLSIDPKFAKYPELSPYTGMGNNPIAFIDGEI